MLIHVAIALLALLVFSAITIDYGLMWVGRNQAQNSADAAALSAATTLAFDQTADLLTRQARARAAARATAQQNAVFGQPADVQDGDVTFPACPPGAPGVPDQCVRVDVFRNQARGNPLPVFFARLGGVASQGVRATATAQVFLGNASDCLAPFAVPDKWQELRAPVSEYNRYVEHGPSAGAVLVPADVYVPPPDAGATGYRLSADYGTRVTLKVGTPADAIASGWFLPVDLPRPGSPATGGDKYRENIASCNNAVIPISAPGSPSFLVNEPGAMIGPTRQGITDLIARDPGAHWDAAAERVVGSAYTSSPRIVAIPLFDTEYYMAGKLSGRVDVKIVNILGFFVEGMSGNDVIGYLCANPHVRSGGNAELPSDFSFLRTIMLVR